MTCLNPKTLFLPGLRDVKRKPPLRTACRPDEAFAALEFDEKHERKVPCRACFGCARDRIEDLTGRCMAEALVSEDVLAVTLTYRDAALAGRHLVEDEVDLLERLYPDVQAAVNHIRKYIERRTHGQGRLRYMISGEYGGLKGRPHWHCLFFLSGFRFAEIAAADAAEGKRSDPWQIVLADRWGTPEVDRAARVNWAGWPHGFSWWDRPEGAGGFEYVVKYGLKGKLYDAYRERLADKPGAPERRLSGQKGFVRWSTNPSLGGRFLRGLRREDGAPGSGSGGFQVLDRDGYQDRRFP